MAKVDRMNRARSSASMVAGVRKKKRKRRGNRTLHYILITIFLLAAGVILSMTVFFKIESVTAVGSDKYSPDEIVAESEIQKGENLFRINSGAVKERLMKKYPYIDDVSVRLRLPGSVQLQITQCVAAGALSAGDETLMITREGKVLERGLLFIPEDIPIISGVDVGDAKPGDMLGENAAEAIHILDYLFNAIDETGFGEITNVNLTDRYNIKIVYENRLLLNLGTESGLADKLNFLREMISKYLKPDAQGLIDASNVNRSLIYTDMPIADAIAGKKPKPEAFRYDIYEKNSSNPPETDKPEDEIASGDDTG